MASRTRGVDLHSLREAPLASFGALFVTMCLVFSMFPLSTMLPNYVSPVRNVLGVQPSLSAHVRNDVHLDQTRCKAEFSRLYPQLGSNEAVWKAKGGIGYADVQNAAKSCRHGCVHVVIKYGQVFIRSQHKDWQSRVRSCLQLLVGAYEGASEQEKALIEGTELVISTADFDGFADANASRGAGWVLDKRVNDTDGQYLFPDFSFASWPEAGIASYQEFRREAELVNAQTPWHSKANRAFWRGDALQGKGIKPRDSLLSIATTPTAESWCDIKRTSFWEQGAHMAKIIPPHQHCVHKFLIHSEGVAYSGRSKFILSCQSTVITHTLEWTQHFHPSLISSPTSPDQNHILLPPPYFQNLPATITALIAQETNPTHITPAQKIAQNAKRTLTDRYLTPAATACYIRAALISYTNSLHKSTWPNRIGPTIIPGSGVKPGAGTPKASLKQLGVNGDVEYGVWCNLGQPEWPPK